MLLSVHRKKRKRRELNLKNEILLSDVPSREVFSELSKFHVDVFNTFTA